MEQQKTKPKSAIFAKLFDLLKNNSAVNRSGKASEWIYKAYFSVKDHQSYFYKILDRLNHGIVTNYKLDGEQIEIPNQDLDKVIHFYSKRTEKENFILRLLCYGNFIPLLIPIFHLSLITGIIGIAIWLVNMLLMVVTTSDNIFLIKLMSRQRLVTRRVKVSEQDDADENDDNKKQSSYTNKKEIISRDEIINEQLVQYHYMNTSLAYANANSGMLFINFFLFPLIMTGSLMPTINTKYLYIPHEVLQSFVGGFFGCLVVHLVLLVLPLIIAFLTRFHLRMRVTEFKDNLAIALGDERYSLRNIHNLLHNEINKDPAQADIVVGRSLITGDDVVLNVKDRANGLLVNGPNGAGKTGSIFKNFLYQDLQKMVLWFRKLPELLKRPDYYTKKVAPKYLSGVIVMEPTNDLCEETYKLAHDAFGIPRDMIRYVNPGDKNSDSINLMRGTANGVANTIVQCISSVSESGNGANEYFVQAQNSWLHNYVLLVKYASVFIIAPVTFQDLFDACLEISNTDKYRSLLKHYLTILEKAQALYYTYARKFDDLKVPRNLAIEDFIKRQRNISEKQDEPTAFMKALDLASDTDDIIYHQRILQATKDMDEHAVKDTQRFISKEQFISNLISYEDIQSYKQAHVNQDLAIPFADLQTVYNNVKDVINWCDMNIAKLLDEPIMKDNKKTQSPDQRLIEKYSQTLTPSRKGNYVYFDRQETSVKGLKNVMHELVENSKIRRVFFNFKQGDNFSINNFYHSGGILLLATGRKEPDISPENSRMIAGIEQSLILNSAQQRLVDDGACAEPTIPMYFDEHIDFMSEEIIDATAQNRKYGTPILSSFQSYSQIDDKFGASFRKVLASTLRTKISFGDLEPTDSEYVSAMMGTHQEFVKQRSNTSVQGSNNDSQRLRGSFQEVPNITPSELQKMQAYTLVIRTNEQNSPIPFDHIAVQLHENDEFKNSEYHVDVEHNPQDKKAHQLYLKSMSANNPDFENIDFIFHEYYLRYQAYLENDRTDIFRNQTYDYNHEVETLQHNIDKNIEFAYQLNPKLDIPSANYQNLAPQDQHILGVPEWVFEELEEMQNDLVENAEQGSEPPLTDNDDDDDDDNTDNDDPNPEPEHTNPEPPDASNPKGDDDNKRAGAGGTKDDVKEAIERGLANAKQGNLI